MDDKRKEERRQPLSDAEKVQLGTVLPHEQRESDRRDDTNADNRDAVTGDKQKEN